MKYILLGLLILALIVPASAVINTTFEYYCPPVVFVNETFTIWVDYQLDNGSNVLLADVFLNSSLTNTTLDYTNASSRYSKEFEVVTNITWTYNLSANLTGYENWTANCSTVVVNPFEITINLWEEVELQTILNTSQYALTAKNYDKQLTDPYINEFAYIIARNNDLDFTGAYNYCNVPFNAVSQIWDNVEIPNYMGNDPDSDSLAGLKSLTGEYIGCDKAWYRGEYISGSSIIPVSLEGNYSLYLVEGTIEWESNLSPPKLIKSNLFVYLGEINLPTTTDVTYDFWIAHSELDSWSDFSDNFFLFLVTIMPILLFVFLISIGMSVKLAGALAIGWNVIWMVISMVL